jgi:hypothetical protein
MAETALFAALLVVALCSAGAAAPGASSYSGFIRIANERFVDDTCKEFLPLGLNACGHLVRFAASCA